MPSTPIPTRTLESKTIVGNVVTPVRQTIDKANQVTGVVPVIAGPPQIDPLDGALYDGDKYLYADIQAECLIGDPSDVNSQIVLKAIDQNTDAKRVRVRVIDDTAVSVEIVGNEIRIRINTGTTNYTNIQTALLANADLPTYFAVVKPGTGAGIATAQEGLNFVEPPLVQAVLDNGGIFRFAPSNRGLCLSSIGVVCGGGSTIDAYIQDIGGANPRKILSGVSGVADDHKIDIPLLTSEEVLVEETVSGAPLVNKTVTLYLVKDQVF